MTGEGANTGPKHKRRKVHSFDKDDSIKIDDILKEGAKLEDEKPSIVRKLQVPIWRRLRRVLCGVTSSYFIIVLFEDKPYWHYLISVISFMLIIIPEAIIGFYNECGYKRVIEGMLRPLIFLIIYTVLLGPAFYVLLNLGWLVLSEHVDQVAISIPSAFTMSMFMLFTIAVWFLVAYMSHYKNRQIERLAGMFAYVEETANHVAESFDENIEEDGEKIGHLIEYIRGRFEEIVQKSIKVIRANLTCSFCDIFNRKEFYGFLKVPVEIECEECAKCEHEKYTSKDCEKCENDGWNIVPVACYADDVDIAGFLKRNLHKFPPLGKLKLSKVVETYKGCSTDNGLMENKKGVKSYLTKYLSVASLSYFTGKTIISKNIKDDLFFSKTFSDTLDDEGFSDEFFKNNTKTEALKQFRDKLIPKSYICIPLFFGCRVIGVVQILCTKKNAFKREYDNWLWPFLKSTQPQMVDLLGLVVGNLVGIASAGHLIKFKDKDSKQYDYSNTLMAANRIPFKGESDKNLFIAEFLNDMFKKGMGLSKG